jgi:hypothetical protein
MIAGGGVWVESDFGSAFSRDGVALAAGAVVDGLEAIRAAVAELPMERAGIRIFGIEAWRPRLAPDGGVGRVAAGVRACLAWPGDVWVSSTPILHESEAASVPGRRRVLQVDYAVGELPGG